MLGRRRPPDGHAGPPGPDLREMVFESGLAGAVMDMAYPNGTATLVALDDGTVSLYTSTGGGIIGGGVHPSVAAPAARWRALASEAAGGPPFAPEGGPVLPAPGRVRVHVLRPDGGRMAAEEDEDALFAGSGALLPVFAAAQDVITALRLIDQGS